MSTQTPETETETETETEQASTTPHQDRRLAEKRAQRA